MMKIKRTVIALGLHACFISAAFAAPDPAPLVKAEAQKIVNDYYDQFNKSEGFTAIAASVFVPDNDQNDNNNIQSVVAGTIGLAPYNKAITPKKLFEIGSITKSFTALILLQLQTENKLSLKDTVGKWLPQYPQWKDVTLTQLLNMTSGIPNYSADAEFEKEAEKNMYRVWTDEQLLTYAHPDQPIKKNPDQLYDYSNSNYILASMIIEKVTGDSFANQLAVRILNNPKVNLKSTYYPAGPKGPEILKSISERMVHGYYVDEKTGKLVDTFNNDLSWGAAAGALVADTENVIRWVQALYHGTLIAAPYREDSLSEMESLVSLKTGKAIAKVDEQNPGGFGLGVASYYDKESKQAFWVYQGSTLGFRVMYFWNPCNDITTVVALNSKAAEGNPESKLGNHIMEANLNLQKIILKHYPDLQCNL